MGMKATGRRGWTRGGKTWWGVKKTTKAERWGGEGNKNEK